MVRQPSATSSIGSTDDGSSVDFTPPSGSRRATPLRSINSPAPSSSSFVSVRSRTAESDAVRRGRADDNDYIGVLVRERAQYAANEPRTRVPEPVINEKPDATVYKAISLWQEQQEAAGAIPRTASPAYLRSLGITDGKLPPDLGTYLSRRDQRKSRLEALARLGVPLLAIPPHLLPRSVCAVHLDLYHYAQRAAILGEGDFKDTDAVLDLTLRLFFRGFGNDTLQETFLKSEELEERVQSYYKRGDWDDLEDPSPVPLPTRARRKRPEAGSATPANMIQRLAYEYDHGIERRGPEAESEMIQRAVVAGLMHVQQTPPSVQRTDAKVPALWYNDGLTSLHLVPQTKITVAQANDLTDRVWEEWKAQDSSA